MVQVLDMNKLLDKLLDEGDIRLISANSNFIVKSRKITPFNFLHTIIAAMALKGTSSLKDYTVSFSDQLSVSLSRNALHKKFNANCVIFLQAILEHLREQIMKESLGFAFIPGIDTVNVLASKNEQLTANLTATLVKMRKLNLFLQAQQKIDDLKSSLKKLTIFKGSNQRALAKLHAKTLIIGDHLDIPVTLLQANYQGSYFLTAYTPDLTNEFDKSLLAKLTHTKLALFEQPITFGTQSKIVARLIAIKLQQALKHQSKSFSSTGCLTGELAKWIILITNLTPAQLSSNRAWEAYTIGWQIEFFINLLLKGVDINSFKHLNSNRIKAEIYLKYLGLGLLMKVSSTLLIQAIRLSKESN